MRKNADNLHPLGRPGFTLVEILIVVVILGILAAIAVPKFANASHSANESSLRDDLRTLRTQIAVYQSQHQDVTPGYPGGIVSSTPDSGTFAGQLTQCTDQSGNVAVTSSPTYPLGPYLSAIPINPVNNFNTVEMIDANSPLTPDDSTGWLYQPATGTIIPNVSGVDSQGNPYAGY